MQSKNPLESLNFFAFNEPRQTQNVIKNGAIDILNPLMTKLFSQVMTDGIHFLHINGTLITSRPKHLKSDLDQYPAILTSRLVNHPCHAKNTLFTDL